MSLYLRKPQYDVTSHPCLNSGLAKSLYMFIGLWLYIYARRWMTRGITGDNSTMVQVMAGWRHAAALPFGVHVSLNFHNLING